MIALDLDDARLADGAIHRRLSVSQVELDIVHPDVEKPTEFKAVALKCPLRVVGKFAFAVLFHS